MTRSKQEIDWKQIAIAFKAMGNKDLYQVKYCIKCGHDLSQPDTWNVGLHEIEECFINGHVTGQD